MITALSGLSDADYLRVLDLLAQEIQQWRKNFAISRKKRTES